jgi:hypothetical protein
MSKQPSKLITEASTPPEPLSEMEIHRERNESAVPLGDIQGPDWTALTTHRNIHMIVQRKSDLKSQFDERKQAFVFQRASQVRFNRPRAII